MNSAALIPDLCIWIDCDPGVAMKRISSETLRGVSNKAEYFETTDLQKRIREGYANLLSGDLEMPTPFDMGAILGPISNEGSQDQLRRFITDGIRSFLHGKPPPINVEKELVDQFQLRSMGRLSRVETSFHLLCVLYVLSVFRVLCACVARARVCVGLKYYGNMW